MLEAAARTGRLPELAKYEILEEIGHGGMATVYRARDKRLGREVAVKVIHPHLRDSTEVASRFHGEAKAVAKLRHRNIVEVYDVSEVNERDQYLVVELVRGTTLRRLNQLRGAMPPEVAAALAVELLDALSHANCCGVVHRDVKPENVLIEHRPAPDSKLDSASETAAAGGQAASSHDPGALRVAVKLTDFGIAKLLDAQGVTSTGQVLGSPAHMAPEQIEGGDVDGRADVFGLGVLFYECMVGHLPFEGGNPAQVLRRVLDGAYPAADAERRLVGSRWSAILDRALAHAPADRFPTAFAMREAVLAELTGLGFVSPARELEAWLDDPVAYDAEYGPRIVERLCARGDDARRAGDSLAAAADYNRALAQAPDDARLLRLVTGLKRTEARARLVRRGGLVLGIAACVFGLVGGARIAFDRVSPTQAAPLTSAPLPSAPSAPSALPAPPADTRPSIALVADTKPIVPEARERADEPPSIAVAPTVRPRPLAASSRFASSGAKEAAGSKPSERTLTLDLSPPMGIALSIDGQPARTVSTRDVVNVDVSPHVFVFSCSVCVPVQISVTAGDKNERMVVSVPVKPATLVVDGSPAKTYQLAEHPELAVRVGSNAISLRTAFEHVTVKEMETGTEVTVRLEAGKTMHAAFE